MSTSARLLRLLTLGNLQTYDSGKDTGVAAKSDTDKTSAYVKSQLSSFKNLDVRYQSGFTDKTTGVEHAYLKQYYNGIPLINTAANVAFKGDKVVSYGSSFIDIDACTFT